MYDYLTPFIIKVIQKFSEQKATCSLRHNKYSHRMCKNQKFMSPVVQSSSPVQWLSMHDIYWARVCIRRTTSTLCSSWMLTFSAQWNILSRTYPVLLWSDLNPSSISLANSFTPSLTILHRFKEVIKTFANTTRNWWLDHVIQKVCCFISLCSLWVY